MKIFRVGVLASALLVSWGAQAALFGDDEARQAIVELRQQIESTQGRQDAENAQLRRSLLELQGQIDQLRAELSRVRGEQERVLHDLSDIQQRQKDITQGVDERLRKLEPLKVSADGREFLAEPAEKQNFEAAMAVFRAGDFKAADAAYEAFLKRYPRSGYAPTALFWLGNAQYANRDYKAAIANFQTLLKQVPDHPRAPEAMLAIANCQLEMDDTRSARRTLDELIKTHPKSEAAKTGKQALSRLR